MVAATFAGRDAFGQHNSLLRLFERLELEQAHDGILLHFRAQVLSFQHP